MGAEGCLCDSQNTMKQWRAKTSKQKDGPPPLLHNMQKSCQISHCIRKPTSASESVYLHAVHGGSWLYNNHKNIHICSDNEELLPDKIIRSANLNPVNYINACYS